MNEYTTIVALANTATLVAGGLVLVFSVRAYRRTGSKALRALVVGFGCIVAGSVLGGLVHLLGNSVALGVVVQSSATAVGFAVLLYSLYVTVPTEVTVEADPADL